MTLVPSEEGDFSTPLRFGRNDGDGGSVFIICAPKGETTHYILRVAPLRGPPIGGQENDRVSYPCSNPYTLSRFAGLPLKGKRGTWREKQASHILHVAFRWLITVMLIMSYDTESKSRNADFISIARRAIHNPRPERPSNLRTLRPERAGQS